MDNLGITQWLSTNYPYTWPVFASLRSSHHQRAGHSPAAHTATSVWLARLPAGGPDSPDGAGDRRRGPCPPLPRCPPSAPAPCQLRHAHPCSQRLGRPRLRHPWPTAGLRLADLCGPRTINPVILAPRPCATGAKMGTCPTAPCPSALCVARNSGLTLLVAKYGRDYAECPFCAAERAAAMPDWARIMSPIT